MQQYRFERLSITNVEHLQTLFKSTYSKTVSLESLIGKYSTKSFGVEWLGHLAFTIDRQPAAFYGVIPCYFRIDQEIFLAAQSADTMTHPRHRRRGLFIDLAKKTYDLARQEGIEFIFGFPNQNSYQGFIKLGWRFMDKPMQLFVIKGSALPWAGLVLKIPGLSQLYQWMMEKLFVWQYEVGDFSDEHGVVRDSLFLRYKNQYTKTFVKKWDRGWAWMKNDGILKVGLLMLKDPSSTQFMEGNLRSTAKRLGCRSIILMTSPNTELYEWLVKITSPLNGLPIGFFNLTNREVNFGKATFEYCDIDIF